MDDFARRALLFMWLLLGLHAAFAALLPGGFPPPNQKPLVDDWAAPDLPQLPLNAIVLEEADEAVWADETLEFNGLRADPRTPRPLQAHLSSFRLPSGVPCHAFDGSGQTLAAFPWESWSSCAVGDGIVASDRALCLLILQLLDTVNFLHGRGSAYLGLDAEVVRIVRHSDSAGDASSSSTVFTAEDYEMRLVGFGAAVRLQSASASPAPGDRRSTYMLDSEVAFHAPELLTSAVLQSNLRSLFQIDSWSVGVLVAMIAGGLTTSPFQAEVDVGRLLLTPEAATRSKIVEIQKDLGDFLMDLDTGSCGFLFRHGWAIRLLLGLLQVDPAKRLTVYQAWCIVKEALTTNPNYKDAANAYLGVEVEKEAEALAAPAAATATVAAPAPAEAAAAEAPPAATPSVEATSDAVAASSSSSKADRPPRRKQKAKPQPRPAAQQPPPTPAQPATADDFGGGGGDGGPAGELVRFRKLAARDSSGEPFRSLEAMLNIGSRGGAYVTIQRRSNWEGIINYGEVIGFRNRADGDRWDVYVPGLEKELPIGEPSKLKRVLGVVLIKGGNHKLCVELTDMPPVSRERVNEDIREFQRIYAKVHPGVQASRIRYLALDELDF